MTDKKKVLDRPLGVHISVAGGLYKGFERAEKYGCTAIQIFVKNQHRWKARELESEDIDKFLKEKERTGIFVFAHAAYLPNLASPEDDLWKKSLDEISFELERCDSLSIPYLIFHPGNYTSSSRDEGIDRIIEAIDKIYSNHDYNTQLVLENTAGQGTSIGSTFEEIGKILRGSNFTKKLGLCYDTCHGFAAGYDIRSETTYKKMWDEFDSEIGMKFLRTIHLNDSMAEFGKHKDRHQNIGKGEIGIEGFRNILTDEKLKSIPIILETPKTRKTKKGKEIDMHKVDFNKIVELAFN